MVDSPTPPPPARVRYAEARSVTVNPQDPDRTLGALKTVIRYTLTDAFGLLVEESMWVGYHLDETLSRLADRKPKMVPLAVRQEMLEGSYAAELDAIEARDARHLAQPADPTVTSADRNDWVAVLMDMIGECYPLRPLDESAIHGQIDGLLRELGVGDPTNPRGARYMPNALRHRLARRKASG